MIKKIEAYFISILILIQRTELQKKIQSSFLSRVNKYSGGLLYLARVLVQAFDSQSVKDAYEKGDLVQGQAQDIYDLIKQLGADNCGTFSVADIGSGIAGYHKTWLRDFPNGIVVLIDQNRFNVSALLYGHGKPDRHYNNLRLARNYLLSTTDISPNQIQLVDKRFLEGVFERSLIVVSFYSLGFHYPLATYWEDIWANSVVKVLLLDIRTNSESQVFLEQKLLSGFEATVVSKDVRSTRYKVTQKVLKAKP
jgi:hypothetical protein